MDDVEKLLKDLKKSISKIKNKCIADKTCLSPLYKAKRCRKHYEAYRKEQDEAKIGKRVESGGYIYTYDSNGKYCLEHRLVASIKLGRELTKTERILWIDGDRLNNHPDNLIVFDMDNPVCPHCKKGFIRDVVEKIKTNLNLQM